MPVASRVLHGQALYGWAFSAFLLGQLIGIVVAGSDSDTHGPKRAYLLGLALFGSGLVACGASPNMVLLVSARFVAGAGSGAVLLLNWALIGRCYPDWLRPRMLAIASSAWVLPGLIGPGIAGAVADYASWRLVFLGLVPVIAIVGVLLRTHIDLEPAATVRLNPTGESFWDASARQRNLASVAIALGAGLLLGGIGATRLIVAAPLAACGLVLLVRAAFVLFPRGTVRAQTGLPAVVASYAGLLSAFVGIEAFLPLVLHRVHHVSATVAGLILSGGTVSWSIGSWVQARHPDRWARSNRRSAAVALFTAGIGVTATLTAASVPTLIGYLAWSLGGIGMGIAFTEISNSTFRVVDEARVGVASSATQLAGSLGGALVAGINGAVIAAVDRTHPSSSTGLRIAFAVDVSVALLALAAARRVPDPR